MDGYGYGVFQCLVFIYDLIKVIRIKNYYRREILIGRLKIYDKIIRILMLKHQGWKTTLVFDFKNLFLLFVHLFTPKLLFNNHWMPGSTLGLGIQQLIK